MQRNLMLWWIVFPYPALTLIKSYKKDPNWGPETSEEKVSSPVPTICGRESLSQYGSMCGAKMGELVCWSRRLLRI